MSILTRLEGRMARLLFSLVIEGPLGRVPGLVTLSTRLYDRMDAELRTSVGGQRLSPAVMPDGWLLYYTDQNERDVRAVFTSLVSEGMFVVDIGASIGPFALVAAAAVGSDGHVLAFEPNPARFDVLRRNVELNDAANVSCFDEAVGAASVESEIPIDDSGTFTENEGTRVSTTTLDERLDEAPDVVKIDVEGGEFDVLAGMTRILSEDRPEILVEVHPQFVAEFDQVAREWETRLADLGYAIYEIGTPPSLHERRSFRSERAHYLLTTGDPPDLSGQTT